MDPLAIYIHWPYCARICPYCDFNVYKRREDDGLLPAILADLAHWRDLSGPRHGTSIHFGGGSPSLMTPAQVGAINETVGKLWGLTNIEIALEANPHEMNAEDWRGYRSVGVNRLSLGIQTFNDQALKFLGRDHDSQTAKGALDLALDIFPSVSSDLIFGWAGQKIGDLADDLSILVTAGVPHISTYQLTIEEGTAFAKAESRGQKRAVNSDASADLYDNVRGTLVEARIMKSPILRKRVIVQNIISLIGGVLIMSALVRAHMDALLSMGYVTRLSRICTRVIIRTP